MRMQVIVRAPGPQGPPGSTALDTPVDSITLRLIGSDPERLFIGRLVPVGDTVSLEWEEITE